MTGNGYEFTLFINEMIPKVQPEDSKMVENGRKSGCVYCGKVKEISNDHIPPKNLFPSPRPINLITVPSCKECNQKASNDDEYFRLVLSMRSDTFKHPEVSKNIVKLQRSLQKPEQKGFRASFLNSLAFVDSHTPAGIYLGKTNAFLVDMKRVNDVIKRITQGLFYKEKGRRLPDNYRVWVCCIDDIINEHPHLLGTFTMKDIISSTLKGKSRTIGNDVFKYWCNFAIDEENSSAMVFSFYGRVNFLALTMPPAIPPTATPDKDPG